MDPTQYVTEMSERIAAENPDYNLEQVIALIIGSDAEGNENSRLIFNDAVAELVPSVLRQTADMLEAQLSGPNANPEFTISAEDF